ncbi:unnamed protein product [Phyllotreta striolata]|uniref:Ionotropic receptor n=1 Tax=Phyllotreta striolata TaxID=444603 RepID=A0A9N9THK9_PHYSR|nr:unnamed protein product [Phyllotreta striolata]
MLVKYFILILFAVPTVPNQVHILSNNQHELHKQFYKFFDKLARCKQTPTTCYFDKNYPDGIRDVIDRIISQNTCVPFLRDRFNGSFKVLKMYIFGNKTDEIYRLADEISVNPHYNSEVEIAFFITERVENKRFLETLLPYIWSKNISKFIVVFVQVQLEVYTYYPFDKRKFYRIEQFGKSCQKLFEDKTKNLNGAPFRAFVFERRPMTIFTNGKWSGFDIKNLEHIAAVINARYTTIGTKSSTIHEGFDNLTANLADVIMVRIFKAHYSSNTTSSYPFSLDYKSVIVPLPKKVVHSLNFFDHFIIFYATLALLATLLLLFSFNNNVQVEFSLYVLVLWGIVYSKPVANLKIFQTKFRILIVILFFSFTIISCNLGTSLLSHFLITRYEKPISTLEELKTSNIVLYVSQDLVKTSFIKSSGLWDKFVPMSPLNIENILERSSPNYAYVLRKDAVSYYCNKLRDEYGNPLYTAIKEPLLSSVGVYYLQKNSPFRSQFSKALLAIEQFGFTESTANPFKFKVTTSEEALKLRHFRLPFYSLFMGEMLAFLVFIIEVLYKKSTNYSL